MNIVDSPLAEEDQEDLDYYTDYGLQTLLLDETADPTTVVQAIARHVEAERRTVQALDQESYALFILSMGYTWGTQVCRAYGWEWRLIGTGEDVATQIVSPQREFVVHPLQFIKKFIDDPQRPSTIMLLFNMLVPSALNQSIPQAQPKKYQWLG